MAMFSQVGTILSGATTNLSDLALARTQAGLVLVSVNQTGGSLSTYRVADAGTLGSLAGQSFATGLRLDAPQALVLEDATGGRAFGLGIAGAGARGLDFAAQGGVTGAAALAGLPGDARLATGFATAAGEFVLVARSGNATFQSYRETASGLVAVGSSLMPVALPAGARIDDLSVVTVGGQAFALSVSSLGNFVACHRLGADGSIGGGQMLGGTAAAPFLFPREVETVSVGGSTFAIVSGGGSSSLTVLRIGADGSLTAVDHTIDEGSTRFAGATEIEAVTVNGRAFLFAAGSDDGITMFTVLPDGRLVEMATLVHDGSLPLADIGALAAAQIGGSIALFAGSATERGIAQLRIGLGAIGVTAMAGNGTVAGTAGDDILVASAGTTQLAGGAGDDLLAAGSRAVTLVGGAGADTFLPAAVLGRIVIADFDAAEDRLDLSSLGMIRSTLQLSVQQTGSGLIVRFGSTVIEVRSHDGNALPLSIVGDGAFAMAHFELPGAPVTHIGSKGGDVFTPGVRAIVGYGLGGNDTMTGGYLADTLNGGADNDQLSGRGGNDIMLGGDGDDTLAGEDGIDALTGGAGNDALSGGFGGDRLSGGLGDDRLWGQEENDLLIGDDGNDLLVGGTGLDTLFGGTGSDQLLGGDGDDVLSDAFGANKLSGEAGNDTLFGGSAGDQILGGDGADLGFGGLGNDVLIGGFGADSLMGGEGNDVMLGQEEADRLTGEAGDDRIAGGTGSDLVLGGAGNDSLWGEVGDDILWGDAGLDFIWAGDGNDVVRGGLDGDRIYGGLGDDLLVGETGNDLIYGEAGRNVLAGNQGNDSLVGGVNEDRLFGDEDNDLLVGGLGNDLLAGGLGLDTLIGGDGADTLFAADANDRADGGAGNDYMVGALGDDLLMGGLDADVLNGGAGRDTLAGGAGADVFVFSAGTSAPGLADIVTDFDAFDRIDLRGLGLHHATHFSGQARELVIGRTTEGLFLAADLNGDRIADLGIRVIGGAALSTGDFLL